MCDGVWWASWMIHSPRSVSSTSMPALSKAALRWISSEAMDLDLTTRLTPFSLARSRMYCFTWAGSAVLKTLAPQASALFLNCSARASKFEEALALISTIWSRTASKSIPS